MRKIWSIEILSTLNTSKSTLASSGIYMETDTISIDMLNLIMATSLFRRSARVTKKGITLFIQVMLTICGEKLGFQSTKYANFTVTFLTFNVSNANLYQRIMT